MPLFLCKKLKLETLYFPGFTMPQRWVLAFRFHLKEVALGLPGKRAGVELPSLILPLLVDHSEDSWTTMGCTTGDTGTGGNGGAAAGCSGFARTDRSEEELLLARDKFKNNTGEHLSRQPSLESKQPLLNRVMLCLGNNCICMETLQLLINLWWVF